MKIAYKIALASVLTGGSHIVAAQHTQVFKNEERYYHEGLELFDRAKYGAAQEAFQKYIDVMGDDAKTADAQYYYALSGLYLFHPDAEQLILNFASNYPSHPKTALANYELGLYYFEQKDYKKAIELLLQAPTHLLGIKQNKELEFKLGYSYFATKDFDNAKTYFDKNKTTGFRQDEHRFAYASNYYAGYIAYRKGDYAAAKADLKIAEQNEAYAAIVPYMVTEILYKENDIYEVIRYGEAALAKSPPVQQTDDIALLVGDAYYQKADYKTAEKYFHQFANGKRTLEPTVQYKIAFTDFKNNNYKNAIANFKEIALKKDALGQNAAYYLGLSYLKENNKQFALTAFDQARKNDQDKAVTEAATLKYAQVNYELGNFREVITSLADFNDKYPNSEQAEEADKLLSDSYFGSNNYAEAIRHIESLPTKSWRILQTYQRVTYYHAVNLFNDAKFPQAVQMLDKSLQYPYDKEVTASSHFVKGEAYSIGQRYNDAINSYAAVFRTTPSTKSDYYTKSRYGIGYAYFNTKEYDKALTHFKAYLESIQPSNPNYNDATVRLADTYYVSKNYAEALKLYERVIASSSPDRDYALFQKGVVLSINNRNDKAKEALQELINKYPKSRYLDDAYYQMAVIDYESGNYKAAVAEFSTLINNMPQSKLVPNALQKRGTAYANLRQNDLAIADQKRVLEEFPSAKVASGALYSLQEVLGTENRSNEFDAYLDRFKSANPQSDALESVEYEAAKTLYFSQKYEQAIPKFEAYLKSYPKSSFAADTRYFLSDSYLRQNNIPEGLKRMKEVINENRSEYVNRAVQRVGDLELEAKNYTEAIKYYSRLRDLASNRKEQQTALIGLMQAYYQSNDYTSAKRSANELISQGNASLNAYNSALLFRAKSTYAQGNMEQALTELRETVASAADVNGAEAQYLIAQILYKQKKYKESIDVAFGFNTKYSNYDFWLGKTFLIIADNYTAQNEMFQAKATLNSIIENAPNKEIVAEAKQKLAKLEGKSTTDNTQQLQEQAPQPRLTPPTDSLEMQMPSDTTDQQ
ncbi:tetratricopeptide repeat protein [Pontibacter sp. E15-1]|uniref:tetratricopeptide repeat protein n=1 Tax=Pontibacter sp. E15-1 TaxID=2919918 RepID=UPI001F4FF136|nr:tetratricopeptide repeat protein [Pontibacter sp. E15-1]MCJ8163698.1 tetratricopeptide repeat protein [Pontibacter sp. E15-1]